MIGFSPLPIAAAVVCGVISAYYIGTASSLVIAVMAVVSAAVYYIIRRKINIMLLLIAAVFSAGVFSYALSSGSVMHKSINYIGREMTVHGVVLTEARENSYDDNIKYTVRVWAMESDGVIEHINDNMLLTTPVHMKCGDSIRIKGEIKDMPSQMNENGFDTEKYYSSQGIFTKIYSEEIYYDGEAHCFSPLLISGKFREAVDSVIYRVYSGDAAAVLSAVLTGNNHHFSEEFDSVLSETAFERLYHPAYVHIMIITVLIGFISCYVPKRARDIAVICILIIYALLNSSSVGFVRCTLTAALTIILRIRNGSTYYPDTISWLVILTGLIMPLMFMNAGFVMSVTAGLLIWAFSPYLTSKLRFLPRFIRRTASVMIICTVFQLPLTALYFSGICIYALIMPFITVPIIVLIIVISPLTLFLTDKFGDAYILKAYLDTALFAMIKLPYFISGLPFSDIVIPTPSVTVMAASAGFVLSLYYYVKRAGRKAVFLAAASFGIMCSAAVSFIARAGTVDFTFVNVGQGDGSLIHKYHGTTLLIDGGGGSAYSSYNPGEKVYLPYLESKGYTDIDAAFVSHYHKDHCQGIIAAIENLDVEKVYLPDPAQCRDESMKEMAEGLKNAAEKNNTEIYYVTENTSLEFDGIDIDIIVPGDAIELSDDGNDTSLIIRAEYNGTRCLYTGDITHYAEKCAIDYGNDLDADILKVSHHGAATSNRAEFIEAVSPLYAVISCGEDNPYGHPREETLDNLSGSEVFRTDINGTITFSVDDEGIEGIRLFRR